MVVIVVLIGINGAVEVYFLRVLAVDQELSVIPLRASEPYNNNFIILLY